MTRFLATIALVPLLWGCGETAPGSAPTGGSPQAGSLAADGKPSAGNYRATDAEGDMLYEELRPDGTYRFTTRNGVTLEEGRWEQKSPALLCFTANRETADEVCYREEIGPDGVWRSTDPNTGAISEIVRLEQPEEP
jgi:hypothetical protein